MEVDKKTFLRWKIAHVHGDNKKISKASGISEVTISHAKLTGRASELTINAINLFYNLKK